MKEIQKPQVRARRRSRYQAINREIRPHAKILSQELRPHFLRHGTVLKVFLSVENLDSGISADVLGTLWL